MVNLQRVQGYNPSLGIVGLKKRANVLNSFLNSFFFFRLKAPNKVA